LIAQLRDDSTEGQMEAAADREVLILFRNGRISKGPDSSGRKQLEISELDRMKER